MIFRRRTPRSWPTTIREFFFPRGGWRRASGYVWHRLRRLPDSPERIARGIAAGIFVSFLPIYGIHFISAALCAWAIRGNILAALLGTFFGNPFTFPFMVAAALETGMWLLDRPERLHFNAVMTAFGRASNEIWHNVTAVFTPAQMHWDRLAVFFDNVYLPFFIGGIPTGLVGGIVGYAVSVPVIRAYQRGRERRMRARFDRLRQMRAQADRPQAERADDEVGQSR